MKSNPAQIPEKTPTRSPHVRTRPFKPCCTASVYKEDYDALVEYAYGQEVTVRQAFHDAVQALGEKQRKLAADRDRRSPGK